MSRMEEIERAIQDLSSDEFAPIAERVHAIEQERLDRQLGSDAAAGRLDFLREEARAERQEGLVRDWPPL